MASDAIENAFGRSDPFWSAAIQFISHPEVRPGISYSCLPEQLIVSASAKAVALNGFDPSYLGVEELRFAYAVGPRDPKIVAAVARTAFAENAIPQQPIFSDLRPEARSVLASFGPAAAAPWLEAARASMNANDSLGTSSAQVAAASRDAAAVNEVAALLRTALSQAGKEVAADKQDRLSELAFALELAGPAAQDHITILEVMSRKTMLVSAGCCYVGTQQMTMACRVISSIGGPAADRVLSQQQCSQGDWR